MEKINNLIKFLKSENEAIFIHSPENRRYFTAFPSSDGYLVVTKNDAVFFTDSRYIEAAQKGSVCRAQLLTRLSEGMGRNYVLKRDGEIIHHAATYAELDNLAVISGVITREEWRGKGVGTLAVRKLCDDLLKEGKKPCLFYYTKQAAMFYKKIGFEEGTGWAKLVLRKG